MKKIGITGGIGSGKSLVSKIFNSLGIPVYNSDDRGRILTKTSPEILSKILSTFGGDFFDNQGQLLTNKLGNLVFAFPDKLRQLNGIVHPEVSKDFELWLSQQKCPYILKESAIIFEHQINLSLDKTILVLSPIEMRLRNITKRDPFRTEEQIKDIISRQMPDEDKIQMSSYIIHNNEKDSLIDQVLYIHNKILKL